MVDLLNWCCLIKQQEELADPVLINVVIITLVFGVSIFGWPGSFEEKSFMSLLGATMDAWGKEGGWFRRRPLHACFGLFGKKGIRVFEAFEQSPLAVKDPFLKSWLV